MARFIKAELSEEADKYRLTSNEGRVYGFTASILKDNLENPMYVVMTDTPEVYIPSSADPGSVLDPTITDWIDVTPTQAELDDFLVRHPEMRTSAFDN